MDKREVEKLEMEVRVLGKRKLELMSEIPKLALKSKKLGEDIEGLQGKYNKSSKDFLAMEKKKNCLAKDIVKKANVGITKDVTEKKKIADLDVEISKLSDQSKNVEKERTEFIKSFNYYNSKIKELDSAILIYKGRLKGVENAENACSDTLNENAKKALALNRKLIEMAGIDKLQLRKYDEIRFKEHVIDGKNAKLDLREAEIGEKKQNLTRLTKKVEDKLVEIDRHKVELTEKIKKTEAMQASFEAQRRALDDEKDEINIERLKVKKLINKKNLKKELEDLEAS